MPDCFEATYFVLSHDSLVTCKIKRMEDMLRILTEVTIERNTIIIEIYKHPHFNSFFIVV